MGGQQRHALGEIDRRAAADARRCRRSNLARYCSSAAITAPSVGLGGVSRNTGVSAGQQRRCASAEQARRRAMPLSATSSGFEMTRVRSASAAAFETTPAPNSMVVR